MVAADARSVEGDGEVDDQGGGRAFRDEVASKEYVVGLGAERDF